MSNLNELFDKYGSDRGFWVGEGHSYGEVYEYVFSAFPDDLKFLEIGIWWPLWKGASMRAWREFRPKAQLFGMDNNQEAIALEAEIGMKFLLADHGSPKDVSACGAEHGPFDVIIDDGSHYLPNTLVSFEHLWPYLNPGGAYIVEDLHHQYGGHEKLDEMSNKFGARMIEHPSNKLFIAWKAK